MSISVARKQRKLSSGVQTIGSPRTLKEVLTSRGQPVRSPKARIKRWYRGSTDSSTVWIRAL
jgi:hypothetical protein